MTQIKTLKNGNETTAVRRGPLSGHRPVVVRTKGDLQRGDLQSEQQLSVLNDLVQLFSSYEFLKPKKTLFFRGFQILFFRGFQIKSPKKKYLKSPKKKVFF